MSEGGRERGGAMDVAVVKGVMASLGIDAMYTWMVVASDAAARPPLCPCQSCTYRTTLVPLSLCSCVLVSRTLQSYAMNALGFSIKRAGILYGTIDEECNVRVNVVYEPPQQGSADSVVMERHSSEEQRAEDIAKYLG